MLSYILVSIVLWTRYFSFHFTHKEITNQERCGSSSYTSESCFEPKSCSYLCRAKNYTEKQLGENKIFTKVIASKDITNSDLNFLKSMLEVVFKISPYNCLHYWRLSRTVQESK